MSTLRMLQTPVRFHLPRRSDYMLTRRRFLTHTSAALALSGFPAIVRGRSPNQRINIAFIGVGGRGFSNLNELAGGHKEVVNVAAICDVDTRALDKASQLFPQAAKYRDFRKLYEKVSGIDAVVVSTTEHTHALATLPALRLKKPVYCEKPLTHHVSEAQRIIEATKAAGVPTQMGTQIHGKPNYRRVVELIQSGAIGPVHEAHVWVSRAWGLQSEADAKLHKDIVYVAQRPAEASPVPAYLDWDLWIGPAPHRPFNEVYFPGPKWYRWWDFGNGTMSDLGSHWNDLPWWALQLDSPLSIEATSPMGPAHPEIAPATLTARYEYGARGTLPPVTVTWHQGASKPAIWQNTPELQKWPNGVLFIGSKGMLVSSYDKYQLLPEKDFVGFTPPAPTIPDSPGQHAQWLNAILDGTPTDSPFDTYSGPLTIANHLGNVAYRIGEKIHWNAQTLQAREASAAPFLHRESRAGWALD